MGLQINPLCSPPPLPIPALLHSVALPRTLPSASGISCYEITINENTTKLTNSADIIEVLLLFRRATHTQKAE